MGQALYRKYRSKSFDELIGQDHIVKSLSKSVKSGNISHAYLFTGPRGTGKTSVARIMAYLLNDIEYGSANSQLDIIEIDAASNRRIDEIRDLRDKINILPSFGKYRVYIIDEVHMLTKEAFNALLKTLEEPPSHVVFILATTEVHKLPETIISRTQRYQFKTVDAEVLAKHLKSIAKSEGFKLSDEAALIIANHGGGSIRDSISLLDQVSSSGDDVDAKAVQELLGIPPLELINKLCSSVKSADHPSIMSTLDELYNEGANPPTIAKYHSDKIRQDILDGTSDLSQFQLLKDLLGVAAHISPKEYLEITLLENGLNNNPQVAIVHKTPIDKSDNPKPTAKASDSKVIEPKAEPNNEQEIPPNEAQDTDNIDQITSDEWPQILDAVKKEAASVYTAIKLAIPDFSSKVLLLNFEFPLHQKKILVSKNRELLLSIIDKHFGKKIALDAVINKDMFKSKKEAPKSQDTPPKPASESISNIFGNVEVLES